MVSWGDHNPQTSLEACTLGTSVSAFGAKKYSQFSFKRGCNLCTCKLNWARDFKKIQIIIKDIFFVHPSLADTSSYKPF